MTKQTYILKNHYTKDDTTMVKATIELQNSQLKLDYQIIGDLSQYNFPKQTKQQRADKLWLDTSFELFIANAHKNAYWEINISPSTEWNIYQFTNYKENMKESNIISSPSIKINRYDSRYELSFESSIKKGIFHKELLINLCVILLDKSGSRNFYSINRRKESPNFHDRDYFRNLRHSP